MKYKNLFLVALVVVLLDQVSKYIVREGLFGLSYSLNTGSAFGMLKGGNVFLLWFSFIVIGLMLYFSDRIEDKYLFFVGLLLGGIIGNLIDRAFIGAVVDFINLGWWPSFNIADASINIGVFGIIWKSFSKK